jgi:adenosine deaminase
MRDYAKDILTRSNIESNNIRHIFEIEDIAIELYETSNLNQNLKLLRQLKKFVDKGTNITISTFDALFNLMHKKEYASTASSILLKVSENGQEIPYSRIK